MIRIVKASTLAALRTEADKVADLQKRHLLMEEKVAEVEARYANYVREIDEAKADARNWEDAYEATVEGVGKWVAQIRRKVDDPVNGTKFQGDLALGLWRAYLDKAEADDEDAFTVRLLTTLLGLGAQADTTEVDAR